MSLLMRMILGATGASTLAGFQKQCRDPMGTQDLLLQKILRQNANTAFGRAHGFGDLRSIDAFRRQVPIGTYASHSPYIDRMMEGQVAQLTAEPPVMFAMTSGTTGKSKYIPVTPESRSAKSQLMRVWLAGLHRDSAETFAGKTLVIVSPEEDGQTPCGIPFGAESGHGYRNMPAAVKPMYVCPYGVYKLKSSSAKYYTALRYAVQQPVTTIFTCNPSTIVKIALELAKYTDRLIEDVALGTLRGDLSYVTSPDLWERWEAVRTGESKESAGDLKRLVREHSEAERRGLTQGLRADPARARRLRELADANGGVLLPRDVWPDVRTISCWTGGTVNQYLKHFPNYFADDVQVRDIGYLASELRGSAPLASTSKRDGWKKVSGPLAIGTNFYEFYPVDRDGPPRPEDLLTLDQLKQGEQYFVYITTLGGLYRYDMNDIVRVDGLYENTPSIAFVQKGKGVTSMSGEKVYETQALQAVEEALKDEAGHPLFIAAVGQMPDPPEPAFYTFLLECASAPGRERALQLARRIDDHLKKLNEEYLTKRKDRIGHAVLRILKPGAEAAYRTRQTEGGKKNDGQFKYMKLTLDTAFLHEFDDHLVGDYNPDAPGEKT